MIKTQMMKRFDGKQICYKKEISGMEFFFFLSGNCSLVQLNTHANLIVIVQVYITTHNETFHLLHSILN